MVNAAKSSGDVAERFDWRPMRWGLKRSRSLILAGLVVLLLLGIATIAPDFLAIGNLVEVANDSSILIMLSLGQMIVILSRAIDLSVAANLALAGMIAALINASHPEIGVGTLIAVATLAGTVMGAFNGLLVWKVRMPPIVVTLGTLAIYRGLVFVLSGGAWINPHQMSASFVGFPRAEMLGVPTLLWIAVAIVVLIAAMLRFTALGRSFYATGGNPTAAVYAGIDIGRIRFIAFCIAGAIAGLSGYLWVARYSIAYVDIAKGFELEVIAACLIGGVSISGGIGTVSGAVLGALFLGVIKNALPVLHISPFWQLEISGLVIIGAVLINARNERRKGRIILKDRGAAP